MYPVSVTLFGKRVFARVVNLRILRRDHARSSRWVLNPMPRILLRDTQSRDVGRREGHMQTEVDCYAATHLGPPEARRCKEAFSPRDLKRTWPC